MKTKLLTLGLMSSIATVAQAGFSPIPLNPASFNRDIVIEAAAPITLNDTVTATMDGGTNRNGNTFFEVGYLGANSLNGQMYTNGLPAHGSFVTNSTGDHYWQMAPDYHTNDAVMIGHANGGRTPVLPLANIKLNTPAKYSNISFLDASGNGPVTVGYTLHFADTSTESGTFSVNDWFNGATAVINASGRVSLGGALANLDAVGCRVFQNDLFINNTGGTITSIDLFYAQANPYANGRAAVFAVAGSTDGVNYSPIGITGYTVDVIVEADAPQTSGGAAGSTGAITNQFTGNLTNFITSTMDGGTNKTGNTWFEKGFAHTLPGSGIPVAGSTFSSATIAATYTMPSTYVGPCATVVGGIGSASANITPATPGAYGALSFLCASANGDTFVSCTVQYQDGSTENNTIFVPDWFDRNIPWSYRSFGRVNPSNRTLNTTPDQFVNPFALGLGTFDYRGLTLPAPQLMDSVINLTNASGIITNIVLNFTNGTASTRTCAFFALSGAAAGSVPPVFGTSGTPTPGQPNNAAVNNVNLLKTFAGTNNVVLAATNIAGSNISYQWKKAPRGGGIRDIFYSFDYSTFANVVDGGRVSGSQSSVLVISNALTADSADYLLVASNGSGAVTSTVVTVQVLSTNISLLVGKPFGDQITPFASDSTPVAESLEHVIDQVAQKWLSSGLQNIPNACCGGILPWTGPVGFQVVPVSGATIVNTLRFYTANDSNGRDPFDYGLEGSNDGGNNWTPITGGVLKGTLSLPTTRNGTGSTAVNPLSQAVVEVNFANTTGYGAYRVTVTNNYNMYGDSLMQVAEIQLLGTLVPNPPVWVRQPLTSSTVFVGSSPIAVATASGNPNPKYQWYKNGSVLIAGATSTSYALPNVQLGDSGTTLSCVASNLFGSITSTVETISVIAAPTQTYPAVVLADHALGYWRLNEGPDDNAGDNGVITHDYIGGRNGYYTNAIINVPGYNPVVDTDTAASFGPSGAINSFVDQILDVDFSRPTNVNGSFSIEAWVAAAPQAANAAVVSKGYNGILNAGTGTGTEQFVLDVVGSPAVYRFLVRDLLGNGHVAQSTVDSSSGTWHHLLGVCDQANGQVLLYVDGALAGSGTIAPNSGIEVQPLPMTIGSRQQSGATEYNNQWSGPIDDVAVYSTALTPAQAFNHFLTGQRAPVLSLQPISITTNANTTVSFKSGGYGYGTITYQWWLSDGVNPTTRVSGQTSSNLTFTATAAQNGNNYQLVVSNGSGAVTSAVATLTVFSGAPGFTPFVGTTQTDLNGADTFTLGHVITLSVDPSGTAPFTYVWKKNGVTITDDYRTFGSTTRTLKIGYAAPADGGTYQVFVSNASTTTPSTLDTVQVVAITPPVALNADTNGWTFNTAGTGAATTGMAANKVTVTSGAGGTYSAAWVNTPVPIGTFNATFIYQDVSGVGGADGATFTIQNAGTAALGGGGGSLGYAGITPSVALAFNIYSPNGYGIAFLSGGTGTGAGVYTAANPVLIGQNADQIRVDLNYDGATLVTKLTDLTSSATYSQSISVNIPAILGSGTGYVGFTGADGGVASTQTFSNFSMFNAPSASINAQKVGGNYILSWPAGTGAYLQTSTSLGATAVWTNDNVDTFRVVGNQAQVTVTPGNGNKFFRLQVFP